MPNTYQSAVVNAPLEQVWTTIKNFHDFSWAPNVITKCESVGDLEGTVVGAKRVLNEAFHETLISWDEQKHCIRYSIDDGPSPVSSQEIQNYVGNIRLLPITNNDTTFVEWSSAWESVSQEAEDFCHNIYVALLDHLAKGMAQ
ncbi:MAG: SRPBCC family protein [Gammaproteobacteria bacterium]|nr:SRPBCC family protein [Gammaproteobacteria bacterium]